MMSRGPWASTTAATAAHSAGSIPSRFIPLSSWIPKGWPGSASKCRVTWSMEFSIGTSARSAIMSVSPDMWPPKIPISGPGPSASRTAQPSSAAATKNRRAPAAASARATLPTPSP